MLFQVNVKKENEDMNGDLLDWFIEAQTKEDAEQEAKDDLDEGYTIIEVVEVPIEKCLEKEFNELKNEIKRQYLIYHYDYENVPIKRYNEIKKEFDSSPDNFYKAIKELNMKLRILRRVSRLVNLNNYSIKQVKVFLSEAVNAETDYQLNEIINKFKEVK